MNPPSPELPDFRRTATLGVAVAGIVLLLPFSVNNALQGRPLLAAGSALIALGFSALAIALRRGRYRPVSATILIAGPILAFLVVSQLQQGLIGALWCYPAVLVFYVVLPERVAWAANGALLLGPVPLAWTLVEPAIAVRLTATLLAVTAFTAVFVRLITRQQERLQAQALTDPLTGLANRLPLSDALTRAVEQQRRTGTPMSLVCLDLDHFKTVNDGHGHAAGDGVLRAVGALLRQRLRRVDSAFRIGGEEFLLLLFATGGDQAAELADEIRRAIAGLDLLPDRSVTLSGGVAELADGEDWQAWARRADAALYRAKDAGRNRVELATREDPRGFDPD